MEPEQITVSIHKENSRKLESRKIIPIQHTDFDNLCAEIESCLQTADRLESFCDDRDCNIIIYHTFGRLETMPDGIGNNETYIGKIFENFLDKYEV